MSDLEFGRRLWRENMRSVGNRYDVETRSRAEVTDQELLTIFQVVKPKVAPSIVEMFKAIDCYCYQACEHEGWETSGPKTWMEELRLQFCSALCRRDYERAEARQRAHEHEPTEGFDEEWMDGGRRSDAAGRL